jgi:hypothetical protein
MKLLGCSSQRVLKELLVSLPHPLTTSVPPSLTSALVSTELMLGSKVSVVTKYCRFSVVLSELVVDDVPVVGFALRLDVGVSGSLVRWWSRSQV